MGARISMGLWALAAFLSAAVALFSCRYVPGVGLLAQNVMENPFSRPWIAIHAAAASTALLLGPFQFLPRLRARRRELHRWIGRTYVAGCLAGGVAGLVLAPGTTAGPLASAGFGLLAVVWLYTTGQALRLAMARRFEAHRRWMIRSFALTFAAVTLRLYLPIPPVMGFGFLEGYVAISWLCWVPNLVAAELYLRRRPLPAMVAAE